MPVPSIFRTITERCFQDLFRALRSSDAQPIADCHGLSPPGV